MPKSRKFKNALLKFFMYLSTGITFSILLLIIGYILFKGLPGLNIKMLTTQTSYIDKNIGILPNILNTLYIIFVSMLFAVPLGIGAAVYLTEYAKCKPLVKAISFAIETLMGIPSIIYGLVGMLFFTSIMGLKQGILAGGLTLTVMIIPTIVTTTKESLAAVPNSLREGSLALGSGKWHMIKTVVLPNAKNGIITGCVLAVGRITGESAALLFTAGFGLKLVGFIKALQSSSATLTVALYIYASEQGEFDIAFTIALILVAITFIINTVCYALGNKIGKKNK